MILRIILFNELEDFLPQGGVRRRPKKVPLSFSALARGALQAPGCAEDRHSPPAGPPEGRRRQWCARRNDANKFLLFDVGSRNHFTKKSNLQNSMKKRRILQPARIFGGQGTQAVSQFPSTRREADGRTG